MRTVILKVLLVRYKFITRNNRIISNTIDSFLLLSWDGLHHTQEIVVRRYVQMNSIMCVHSLGNQQAHIHSSLIR
jgi:hypothetical protein